MSILTKRQVQILTIMRDNADSDDGELVYEPGAGAYLGYMPVTTHTVNAFLRMMAIRKEDFEGKLERYTINETGRKLLEQYEKE